MSQINYGGVLKGGLAAGLVINVSEFVLNVPVAGARMEAELAALNLPPVSGNQIAVFITMGFLIGLLTVWLYAAIRPRFGPSPTTAIIAGVVTWVGVYLYSTVAYTVIGVNSMGLAVLVIVWTLVEMIAASAVGGYLYKEE